MGFNVWNPYCHTPCGQPTPTTGNPDKDFEGAIAQWILCDARDALEMCKVFKETLYEDLQDQVNAACCPHWPCNR